MVKTNATTIKSVNNVNENQTSNMEINTVLNIILIAIGFVLILLAIAILIRIK